MSKLLILLVLISLSIPSRADEVQSHDADYPKIASNREGQAGIRGDAEAIEDAEAMVEAMGGKTIWGQLQSIQFVHEWFPYNRVDSYIENEVLDLSGPRSVADRKSEISHTIRSYSPEGGYWTAKDGEFTPSSDEVLAASLARAPFNFYRLVKAVAVGDPFYELQYGEGDIPGARRLEFYGPSGVLGGWIILNAKYEPIVKATPAYRYTLGPLKRFGNLRIPDWGVYDNGYTRYELISVSGDNRPPEVSVFLSHDERGG